MFKFLFSIFIFVVVVVFIIIAYFVWMFWKMRQKMSHLSERAAEQRRERERAARGDDVSMRQEGRQQQKIFADDEGEYVDFEEEK